MGGLPKADMSAAGLAGCHCPKGSAYSRGNLLSQINGCIPFSKGLVDELLSI